MSKLTEIAADIIDGINDRMAEEELDVDERMMVMSCVGENCRIFVETIMAHDYHKLLYEKVVKQ